MAYGKKPQQYQAAGNYAAVQQGAPQTAPPAGTPPVAPRAAQFGGRAASMGTPGLVGGAAGRGAFGGRAPGVPNVAGAAAPPPAAAGGARMPGARGGMPGLVGGAAGRTPPTGSGGGGSDGAWGDIEKLYGDILKSHQGAWGGIESGVNANMALNQRRAAEMNAGMGRSIGGGFAGGQAQAYLGGQQQMINARSGWESEGRDLQMGWLDRVLEERRRIGDLNARAAEMEPGPGNVSAGNNSGSAANAAALARGMSSPPPPPPPPPRPLTPEEQAIAQQAEQQRRKNAWQSGGGKSSW